MILVHYQPLCRYSEERESTVCFLFIIIVYTPTNYISVCTVLILRCGLLLSVIAKPFSLIQIGHRLPACMLQFTAVTNGWLQRTH